MSTMSMAVDDGNPSGSSDGSMSERGVGSCDGDMGEMTERMQRDADEWG